MTDLASAAPKRLRHAGDWPTPLPRRAPPGTELRALQDAMPRCARFVTQPKEIIGHDSIIR